GVVVMFFVSFMGSLMVYLGKWGMSETVGTEYFNRNPSYMFIWAPTSYEWRTLLIEGPSAAPTTSSEVHENYRPWNWIGTSLITLWIYLIFLMVIGFGYSYFWCQLTTIYLLMRRKVDDIELDEVYLEEDEPEDAYSTTLSTSPPPPGGTSLPMVEPHAVR